MKRIYHKDGSAPEAGQIFVFGSNLSGIHGAGAARAAHKLFGAQCGIAEGRTGESYALPTVQERIAGPLTVEQIKGHVEKFIAHAEQNQQNSFFVTRVGCGLAGHKDKDIAPLFRNSPENCEFPENWRFYLEQKS